MSLTTRLWTLITLCLWNIPWLVIAAIGIVTFFRNKAAPRAPLIVQILGAVSVFAVAVLRWLVLWILDATNAPYTIYSDTGTIFNFLGFLTMLIFAIGYGWEKLPKRKNLPGFPVR
ncbi:MAG TPA: hypothetical protein VHQ47_05925 [Phycisphaerae bacterium]|nr:hypothetical protein [Phycisphaerae bacterium]